MRRSSLDPAPLAALAPDLVVEVLETATSTNAVASDRARAGAAEGPSSSRSPRPPVADAWTAPGRRRRAPPAFSVVLRPAVPPAAWPWLPLLTGYAVAEALRAEGYDAGVKWPNDVLIERRGSKVVGILVERVETPDGPAAVVGHRAQRQPDRRRAPGADRDLAGDRVGLEPDRTALLVTLLRALREAYDAWQAGGQEATARLARRTPPPA